MGIKGDGGGVVLTTNDGYGNANVCFNHKDGIPDSAGSSCRIETSVDNNTGFFLFEIGDSVSANQAVALTETLKLTTSAITYKGNTVWHAGNLTNNNQLTNGAGYITSSGTAALANNLTGSPSITVDDITVNTSHDLSFGSATRQMINLYGTVYGLGVQSNTLYYRSDTRFSWFRDGSHSNTENNAGTGGTVAMTLDGSSNLVVTSNVTAYSDITLKKNIESIPNALDKVLNLRGVTYNRIDIENEPRQTGVIAQEVEEVLPEVVNTDEETGIKSVAYGNMVGLLIEAIKEQQQEINNLKEMIRNLS